MLFKIFGKLATPSIKQQASDFLGSVNTNRDCSLFRAIALSSLTTTCILGLSQAGLLQDTELKSFDLLTQVAATSDQSNHLAALRRNTSKQTDQRIVIVAITEEDIQAQNQWPLSDQVFATLLKRLQKNNPAVIGLDIYRDIPHTPGTQALAKQLQQSNVIAVDKLGFEGEGDVPAPPDFPEDRVGFTDFVIDADGTVRRHFMFAALGDTELYSFSLRLAQQFLAQKGLKTQAEPNAIALGDKRIAPISPNTGGYHNIGTEGYQALIRYRAMPEVAQQLSLKQVLSGDYDPDEITGKIVIIGTTAASQQDIFQTPFSATADGDLRTPGVAIHAQLTNQLLSTALDGRSPLSTWPQWAELSYAALWGLCGGLIVWQFSHPRMIAGFALMSIASISATAGLLFVNGVWIPVALPLSTLIGTGASLVVYKEFRKTFYDNITGLPNRALFTQELQKRLKQQPYRPVAVILLDIDSFKLFNESFGLRSGDRLLQTVAKKLKQNLPDKTQAARIAGDEFVVLIEPQKPTSSKLGQSSNNNAANSIEAQAIVVAKQLAQTLSTPIDIFQQKVFPSLSTGIAISSYLEEPTQSGHQSLFTTNHPEQTINAEDLLRDAQTAISRAKSKGRGRCETFSPDMRAKLSNRIWIEADLREAIARQQLRLHYQPLVCLKTMKLAGFEALIRWQHPTRGMISPGEFISVAEDTGLIIPIGQWVLEVACQQAQQWREQFPHTPPFMSVNLSGRQFAQRDLVARIDQILTRTDLERSALKLELTESVVMDDVEASIDILLQLKALGLKLGIDDFGTGYSSLSYLHRFPIDMLKVDRSFVMEMEAPGGTAELVKTIIALGHNLGMNVVAEGIEEESQAQKLQALQCEYGQGYLFAKPLPTQEAEALLANPIDWHKHM